VEHSGLINIQLEVGKRYVLRNGIITGPLRTANNGTNYKYEAEFYEYDGQEKPYIFAWLENGSHLHANIENRYDIVKEYITKDLKTVITDYWYVSKAVKVTRYDRMIYVKDCIKDKHSELVQGMSDKRLWLLIEETIS
jgi:hypothetical protein